MSLTITLTNAQINEGRLVQTAAHQKVQQGSDYLPCKVNLVSEITVGLAILNAVQADDLLWAAFGNASEKDILAAITSIAFVNPAQAISIQAYQGDVTHGRAVPVAQVTYLPFVRLYRNYVLGGATLVQLDLGVAL